MSLGKPELWINIYGFKQVAGWAGFPLDHLTDEQIRNNDRFEAVKISDVTCFRALGFSEASSMDISDYEGADFAFDLNNTVPEEFHERFDVIFDGGTLEHIFDVPSIFRNICLMLKINGRVVHESPSNGWMDHGFYNIQPTLYYDFYKINGFDINRLCIAKNSTDQWAHLRDVYEHIDYTPGMYDFKFISDSKIQNVFLVATKKEKILDIRKPQQSLWGRITDNHAQQNKNNREVKMWKPSYMG
ncbi:MAG: class I SAM-dependent methyltransferase [Magnetococcales bacterium]|nr:class I SAM-dependent methyltransferase [Magnetococcales bacterium]